MRCLAAVTLAATLLLSMVSPAAAQEGPVAVEPETSLVQVRQSGGLTEQTAAIATASAVLNRSQVSVLDRVTLRAWAVRRGETVIQQAPEGYGYPLLTAALDPSFPLLTDEARSALARGEALMGQLTAALRGAVVGDIIDLEPLAGGSVPLVIGSIVPDDELFYNEVVVSKTVGLDLGIDRPFALLIHGGALDRVEGALRGSIFDPDVRVIGGARNDPADQVLSAATVKARFGEFAIRNAGGDSVDIDPAWLEANIVTIELPHLGLFQCHRLVVPYLRGVLAELTDVGALSLIDPADFQVAGGCFNPRFNRGADPGYSLSRHAWGIAIDINPSTNPYGAEPAMPAALIDAFRRWGFSWGGSWGTPDGMHFEWQHLPLAYSSNCADLTVMPLYAGGLWYLRPAAGDCS